jgi:hypothetical protein
MASRLPAAAGAGPSRRALGLARDRRGRRSAARPEHAHPNKIQCLWKPAQSGKTRTIMEMIREHEETAEHLNIVICSNIRLLVSQTTARMTRDLFRGDAEETDSSDISVSSDVSDESAIPDDRIEGDVFSWMSGTARSNIATGELADRVKEDEVTMVVCCSHKARFRYLNALLENLEKSKHFRKRVNVWIDEADVSIKLWSSKDFDFTRFSKVDRVCLVSATFNSVVKMYGRIKVLGFETTHPDCYMPLKECDVVEYPSRGGVVENLASVLEMYPEVCASGMRLFAPGMIEVSTHDEVADYLLSKGFAVMILNGQRKCILCPDGEVIPLALRMDPTTPDEISTVLPRLYAKHNLARWPFAVTGQMCLGRGITFQSEEFAFDYGVLPDLTDAASAYQCVARLLGNIKDFEGFVPPTVFMSPEMKAKTDACETLATLIAKKVLEHGWADVGEPEIECVLTGADEVVPIDGGDRESYDDDDYDVSWSEEFTNVADLRAARLTVGRMPEPGPDGFHKNANGGKGAMSRDQLNALKTGKKTTNMRLPLKEVGDVSKRTYPFYEDAKDKSTLRFVVRTLTRLK